MKTTALKTVKTVDTTEIPDGTYPGKWSGYLATFEVGDIEYMTHTVTGIRGVNISCAVTVSRGVVTVEK